MSLFKDQIVKLTLKTRQDLSTATKVSVLYVKPDQTKGEWVASVAANNTDIEYQTEDGDIDQAGNWTVQAYAEVTGGKWFGDIDTLKISDNIKA